MYVPGIGQKRESRSVCSHAGFAQQRTRREAPDVSGDDLRPELVRQIDGRAHYAGALRRCWVATR